MIVIVLTGGIGSGKSVASEYFAGRGAFVIDLDQVARQTMEPGSPVLAAVAAEFGTGVVTSDGALDRDALARACFVDKEAARRLDAIVHPSVQRATISLLGNLAGSVSPPDVVVLEVPLLAEAPAFATLGDLIVAITAPESIRVERVVSRGMERSDVERRVRVQALDTARIALADVVIENSSTLEEYVSELEGFWDERLGADGLHG
jgi:dephospho-CoA kinase